MAMLDYESGGKVCECGKRLAEGAEGAGKCPRCGKVFTSRAAWVGLWVAVGIAVLGPVIVVVYGMMQR